MYFPKKYTYFRYRNTYELKCVEKNSCHELSTVMMIDRSGVPPIQFLGNEKEQFPTDRLESHYCVQPYKYVVLHKSHPKVVIWKTFQKSENFQAL